VDLHIDWLADELETATFQDRRLSRRLGALTRKLCRQPDLSFPKALNAAELEGAYRFFGNPVVTPELVLSGHFEATRWRCLKEQAVIVIHDSTTLRFRSDGGRKGLGRLVTSGQTFFAHAALVVADDATRRPLGVAGLETWTRSGDPDGAEHARWGRMVEQASEHLKDAALIHVMDREADDYVLFAHLVAGQHRFVIRSMQDRLLLTEARGDARKLSDAVASIQRVVEREAPLSKRVDGKRSPQQKKGHPSRASRVATLGVGATTIRLQRPRPYEKRSLELPSSIELNVVRVWEPNPPLDQPAVEWVLLTTESVETLEDILRVVDRYRVRWTIEEFFKALKTGCAYESRQLEDYESLVNALAVFAPIACTLLSFRSEYRRAPDAPAETIVAPTEIEVLRALGRTALPPRPTVSDIVLAIAALGGHIKHNGEPGWLTLSRGYSELLLLARGWQAAKLQLARDQ
jgi:hypothetical protein